MKRILTLAFAVLALALLLVSCENGVGDFQYPYTPKVTNEMSLNMYIICEDDSSSIALTTVADDIADYTETKYKTKVNVIYKTASEYLASVRAAVDSNDNDIKAGIVLINSKSLLDELVAGEFNGGNGGKLLDLTSLYATKNFGPLKKQINSALLSASYVVTTPDDPATQQKNEEVKKIFTVPNNRVLGEYTYLVIDKAAALESFIGTDVIKSFTSREDAVAKLPADAVEVVKGPYEMRFEYGTETDGLFISSEYYCSIIEKPTVSAEDAFASAFAVVKGGAIPKKAGVVIDDAEFAARAMEIIFAINNDVTLRNILQYGRENSNYVLADGEYNENGVIVENGGFDVIEDANVADGFILLPNGTLVAHNDANNADKGYVLVPNGYVIPKVGSVGSYYNMNLEYTGDSAKALYSYYPTIGYIWSEDMLKNTVEQNKDVSLGN